MAIPQREVFEREAERVRQREYEQRQARAAAGLSFWRLVWIIALGVLLAQVIGGAALWLVRSLASPGILR